jgi:hypothetical protein
LVKPVCNFVLYYFQYLGDGWNGQKQDGIIPLLSQLYLVNDFSNHLDIKSNNEINDKTNVYDVNLDHIDVTGIFRKDNLVIDLWISILNWIKNH